MAKKTARRSPSRPASVIGKTVQREVAFCGPLGVGKTTAVRVSSTIDVANTEVPWNEAPAMPTTPKRSTTVGIDYGEWHSEEFGKVALYGTPGQERFDLTRKGALHSRCAVVLWLMGHNDYALGEAQEWIDYISRGVPDVLQRLTVAVTRLDRDDSAFQLADFRSLLDEIDPQIALTAADPRESDDVYDVIRAALRRMEEK
ncbi:hypothetical protein [Arsenicicoccus dermatophilus]|uniref:hypothetical protein n=1 Tax=Arsenicicoccus dermatophilus TaxID=1076331 RepID=UPI0039175340